MILDTQQYHPQRRNPQCLQLGWTVRIEAKIYLAYDHRIAVSPERLGEWV